MPAVSNGRPPKPRYSFVWEVEKILYFVKVQKQPPEVFYKNRCSLKFRKIHRKAPVSESQACKFIQKETLVQVFSCELREVFKKNFFTEHLRTTAFESKLG